VTGCGSAGVTDDGGKSPKGSRKNNFPEFAPGFAPDSVATIERIHRRSLGYVEEFAIEERPKMA